MGADKKSGIDFPNYRDIAKAHKISYFKISNKKKLNNKLSDILSMKGPIICELLIDPEQPQKPKAINRRTPTGKSIPTKYEDMYPFLEKQELLNASYDNFLKNNTE